MTSRAENNTVYRILLVFQRGRPRVPDDQDGSKWDLRQKLNKGGYDLQRQEAGRRRSFVFSLLAILKKTVFTLVCQLNAKCLLCLEHSNQVGRKSGDD